MCLPTYYEQSNRIKMCCKYAICACLILNFFIPRRRPLLGEKGREGTFYAARQVLLLLLLLVWNGGVKKVFGGASLLLLSLFRRSILFAVWTRRERKILWGNFGASLTLALYSYSTTYTSIQYSVYMPNSANLFICVCALDVGRHYSNIMKAF